MRTVIALLAFAAVLKFGDATISAWTEPVLSSADGSATAATTIAENVANGASTGVTIQASSGNGGTPTYAISSQPTSGKLTIASDTGLLTLAVGTFDFETEPTYILVIVATDTDTTAGIATVTLGITNVNEAPTFAATQYAATVPDGSTQNTAVVTVSATDVDAGDTISYSITAGDTNSHFTIGSSSGAITVSSSATLAAGTLAGYSLTVTATDAGSLTDTTTVWIAVTDCSSSGSGALVASLLTIFVAVTVFLY